jgi:hypothetical protein
VDAQHFTLDVLISQMKELRQMHLGDQVKAALESTSLGIDSATLSELVREFESDIEEHIERLERIGTVLTEAERANPEHIEPERRREIAFKSGCDFEEIDSLCEAFERARALMEELKAKGGVLDIKELFSTLPGLSGIESDEVQSGLLKGILDGSIKPFPPKGASQQSGDKDDDDTGKHLNLLSPKGPNKRRDKGNGEVPLEDQIDTGRTHAPKNRLPKDWNPPGS